MNKFVILTIFAMLLCFPVLATDSNTVAQSDAGRIINRIFNNGQKGKYYNRSNDVNRNNRRDVRNRNRSNTREGYNKYIRHDNSYRYDR